MSQMAGNLLTVACSLTFLSQTERKARAPEVGSLCGTEEAERARDRRLDLSNTSDSECGYVVGDTAKTAAQTETPPKVVKGGQGTAGEGGKDRRPPFRGSLYLSDSGCRASSPFPASPRPVHRFQRVPAPARFPSAQVTPEPGGSQEAPRGTLPFFFFFPAPVHSPKSLVPSSWASWVKIQGGLVA